MKICAENVAPARQSSATVTANLRRLLAKSAETLVAPGASDALSASLIEAHGFECVYIGSYATAASRYALPDSGLLSLEQLASQAKTIADAVRVPVIADAEAFDDAVPAFEAAGWRRSISRTTPAPASTRAIHKAFTPRNRPPNASVPRWPPAATRTS